MSHLIKIYTVCPLVVPQRKSKGIIVMGSFVRPSVLRHNLVPATPDLLQFSRDFDEIFQLSFPCAYFIEVMLDRFLPELWPFNNFSAVSLVSATPLAVFSGF